MFLQNFPNMLTAKLIANSYLLHSMLPCCLFFQSQQFLNDVDCVFKMCIGQPFEQPC